MATPYGEILAQTEDYLTDFFQKKIGAEFVFHDFNHTLGVLEAVIEIGTGNNLDERELNLLMLAAWFHDSGYDQGADGHEERSCHFAVCFLVGVATAFIHKKNHIWLSDLVLTLSTICKCSIFHYIS